MVTVCVSDGRGAAVDDTAVPRLPAPDASPVVTVCVKDATDGAVVTAWPRLPVTDACAVVTVCVNDGLLSPPARIKFLIARQSRAASCATTRTRPPG